MSLGLSRPSDIPALVYGMTLATRNTQDVVGTGVAC